MTRAAAVRPLWRKSSACLPRECVEVASHGGHVLVRDSADASGAVLEFGNGQWRNFIREIASRRGSGRKAPGRAARLWYSARLLLPATHGQPNPAGAALRFPLRSVDIMNGSNEPDAGQHNQPGRSDQRHLLAYSAGSGVIATAAATVTGLAASGTARTVVWAAVLGSVSLLAGLAYVPGPLRALRLARQVVQRARVRA
jgi:Domain of unknown function (DUF397)